MTKPPWYTIMNERKFLVFYRHSNIAGEAEYDREYLTIRGDLDEFAVHQLERRIKERLHTRYSVIILSMTEMEEYT